MLGLNAFPQPEAHDLARAGARNLVHQVHRDGYFVRGAVLAAMHQQNRRVHLPPVPPHHEGDGNLAQVLVRDADHGAVKDRGVGTDSQAHLVWRLSFDHPPECRHQPILHRLDRLVESTVCVKPPGVGDATP